MCAMYKDAAYQLIDPNPMQQNALAKRMQRFRSHGVTRRMWHYLASGAPENHARTVATPQGWE